MRIVLVDDGIPFDGATPALAPLGAAQKAFALLPGALAHAGHTVCAFNRAAAPAIVDGAEWPTWTGQRPAETDILIAFRKPELLGFVARAKRRFLWLWDDPAPLSKPSERAHLVRFPPVVVLLARSQLDAFDNPDRLRAALVPPGMGDAYLIEEPMAPADPPRAVTTAHPLHGIEWLVGLWSQKIRPIAPTAELHVHSAALTKGLAGEPVAPAFERVLALVRDAAGAGVRVVAPASDPGMAAAFRAARVHLHPGHSSDVYCHTIAESQSCGLPAVVRPRGAAAQRIVDRTTGFVADSDDAFAFAALRLLSDGETFERMSTVARRMQRGRSWREVASDFEAHWG